MVYVRVTNHFLRVAIHRWLVSLYGFRMLYPTYELTVLKDTVASTVSVILLP